MNNDVTYISPEKTGNINSDCFSNEFNINDAYISVKKYGFYCCKNYIKGDQLRELSLEYENSFNLKNLPFLKKKHNYRINIQPKLNYNEFIQHSHSLLNNNDLLKFTKKYWKKNYIYPYVITYFKSDSKFPVADYEVPLHLHMDKQKTLRYFIYLDDVGSENAPLTVIPGTLNKIQKLRKKFFWKFQSDEQIPNKIKTEKQNIFEILAPAGSLIILDTDVVHGAKKITDENSFRRVVRFDSVEKLNFFEKKFIKYRSLILNKVFGKVKLPSTL